MADPGVCDDGAAGRLSQECWKILPHGNRAEPFVEHQDGRARGVRNIETFVLDGAAREKREGHRRAPSVEGGGIRGRRRQGAQFKALDLTRYCFR